MPKSTVQSVNRQYIANRVRDITRKACQKANELRKKETTKLPTTSKALKIAIDNGSVRLKKHVSMSGPLMKAFEPVERVSYDSTKASRVRKQVQKDAAVIHDLLAINDPNNLDKIAKLFQSFVEKWDAVDA